MALEAQQNLVADRGLLVEAQVLEIVAELMAASQRSVVPVADIVVGSSSLRRRVREAHSQTAGSAASCENASMFGHTRARRLCRARQRADEDRIAVRTIRRERHERCQRGGIMGTRGCGTFPILPVSIQTHRNGPLQNPFVPPQHVPTSPHPYF